jgi:hypothetical protein
MQVLVKSARQSQTDCISAVVDISSQKTSALPYSKSLGAFRDRDMQFRGPFYLAHAGDRKQRSQQAALQHCWDLSGCQRGRSA